MRKKLVILLFSLMVITLIVPTMSINAAEVNIGLGDYIQMGTYYGEPIKWRCVAFEKIIGYDDSGNPIIDSTNNSMEYKDGYLPLILSDKIICLKAFDAITDENSENTENSHSRRKHNLESNC